MEQNQKKFEVSRPEFLHPQAHVLKVPFDALDFELFGLVVFLELSKVLLHGLFGLVGLHKGLQPFLLGLVVVCTRFNFFFLTHR